MTLVEPFVRALQRDGIYLSRERAETRADYVQPIPLALVQYGNQVLALPGHHRLPGDRLHGLCALWFGGHIDEQDDDKQDDDKQDRVNACLVRELREEVSSVELPAPERVGLVRDRRSPQSALHVGIVHHIVVRDSSVVHAIQQPAPGGKPGGARTKLIDLAELRSIEGRLEPWSLFIIRRLFPDALQPARCGSGRPVDAMTRRL